MKFILRPILSEMKGLYATPVSSSRFATYLNKLQGDRKDDLKMPIMGFNPIAKSSILYQSPA